MSRIGKQLIPLPTGVTVTDEKGHLTIKGEKGVIELDLPAQLSLKQEEGSITLSTENEEVKAERAMWGTWASHVKNAVTGVTEGFSKTLELNGVGYKVALQGKTLVLNVGYSHPVEFTIPEDLSASVEKNLITITGIQKQRVGQIASEIRAVRKVEPYKGKGLKYEGEHVRRKAGKVAKSAA